MERTRLCVTTLFQAPSLAKRLQGSCHHCGARARQRRRLLLAYNQGEVRPSVVVPVGSSQLASQAVTPW